MQETASFSKNAQTRQDEAATLRTLNAFAVDLIAIPSEDDLLWYVAQNVVGRLNFVDCVIYLADDAQTELVQVAALGEKNPYGRSILNPLKIPFGQGITGQVAEKREAIVVEDLLEDRNYIADTQPARSEICVPILRGNRVVGVIDSEHPDPAAFGDAELEVLITIAALTSAKLELLSEANRSKQRYRDLVQAHAELSRETSNRKALEGQLYEARKLEAVGRLTGRFAHEFNNLLTVISGNLEFLEAMIADDDQVETLNAAQTAARRGAQLIDSMLAFSQRGRLSPQDFDLGTFVRAFCRDIPQERFGKINLDLTDQAGPVFVDEVLLGTVLSHLLQNARDAMPEGGEIRITTERITHGPMDQLHSATPLAPGSYVKLSIHDTGTGIVGERLQQIFDPFFTTKPVGAGIGLGLSMTLGFMQQSGGTVEVQSKEKNGATFHLYFPISQSGEVIR